jgi:hypothetical protein
MKFNLKATGIVFASVLTAFTAISGSVRAENNQIEIQSMPRPAINIAQSIRRPKIHFLGCKMWDTTENKLAPFVTNTTNQIIPTGQVIHVRIYEMGKALGGEKSDTLNQPLAPQNTAGLSQIQVSGGSSNGFSCSAIYLTQG